jgi:acetylornithine deacetylase/succinyl-diaminopimelate desuccinylase-like protein
MTQFLRRHHLCSRRSRGPTLLPETEALIDQALRQGEALGFTARRAAGGLVGILEYGRGEETVGVLIHLDVVPPGELSEWERPPFSGDVANGRIYGRGAQDDKGALPGVLWGAKILIDEGMTFPRRLRIILGTKEETDFGDVRRSTRGAARLRDRSADRSSSVGNPDTSTSPMFSGLAADPP